MLKRYPISINAHANKKKRLKDERLEKEYPEDRSDFSFEVVDKTLVNMSKSSMV